MGYGKYLMREIVGGAEAIAGAGIAGAETAYNVGKFAVNNADKVTGFAAGFLGNWTGLYSQVSENLAKNEVKTLGDKARQFGRVFTHSSGHSAHLLGSVDLANSMVTEVETGAKHSFMGYKLSTAGKLAAAGVVGYSAVQSVAHDVTKTKMGQVSPQRQAPESMTFDYDGVDPSQTGADGNLVFALNKLRSR